VVLLHMCAHNPTGMDLTLDQWKQVAAVIRVKLCIAVQLNSHCKLPWIMSHIFLLITLFDLLIFALIATDFSKLLHNVIFKINLIYFLPLQLGSM